MTSIPSDKTLCLLYNGKNWFCGTIAGERMSTPSKLPQKEDKWQTFLMKKNNPGQAQREFSRKRLLYHAREGSLRIQRGRGKAL